MPESSQARKARGMPPQLFCWLRNISVCEATTSPQLALAVRLLFHSFMIWLHSLIQIITDALDIFSGFLVFSDAVQSAFPSRIALDAHSCYLWLIYSSRARWTDCSCSGSFNFVHIFVTRWIQFTLTNAICFKIEQKILNYNLLETIVYHEKQEHNNTSFFQCD